MRFFPSAPSIVGQQLGGVVGRRRSDRGALRIAPGGFASAPRSGPMRPSASIAATSRFGAVRTFVGSCEQPVPRRRPRRGRPAPSLGRKVSSRTLSATSTTPGSTSSDTWSISRATVRTASTLRPRIGTCAPSHQIGPVGAVRCAGGRGRRAARTTGARRPRHRRRCCPAGHRPRLGLRSGADRTEGLPGEVSQEGEHHDGADDRQRALPRVVARCPRAGCGSASSRGCGCGCGCGCVPSILLVETVGKDRSRAGNDAGTMRGGDQVRSGVALTRGHVDTAADQDQHGADDQPGETLAAGVGQEATVVAVAVAVAIAVAVFIAVAVAVAVAITVVVLGKERDGAGAGSEVPFGVRRTRPSCRLTALPRRQVVAAEARRDRIVDLDVLDDLGRRGGTSRGARAICRGTQPSIELAAVDGSPMTACVRYRDAVDRRRRSS